MQDRYANKMSTGSRAALDAYIEGVDLFLAAQAGADKALKRAIAEDPSFALAHTALARHHQTVGNITEAVKSMSSARALSPDCTPREQSHITIIGHLIDGKAALAYQAILKHVADDPRDALILQPCAGVFSLIAFSGRMGREAETFAFFDSLKTHLDTDWWFDSVRGFSLAEIGRLNEAEPLLERSYTNNPSNANAAHYKGHFHYEAGEHVAGRKFIHKWLKSYDPSSMMHCHISWHDALWALELGETDTAWHIIDNAVRPGRSSSPSINILTDMVSFLLRAELAGEPRREDLWKEISEYAARHFSAPGVNFADAHAAIAHAMSGDYETLRMLRDTTAGTASDVVNALADVYQDFVRSDWQGVIDGLVPVMGSHERLGGSKAQRDFMEFTLLNALMRLGKAEEANRLFAIRRPILSKDGLLPSIFSE